MNMHAAQSIVERVAQTILGSVTSIPTSGMFVRDLALTISSSVPGVEPLSIRRDATEDFLYKLRDHANGRAIPRSHEIILHLPIILRFEERPDGTWVFPS